VGLFIIFLLLVLGAWLALRPQEPTEAQRRTSYSYTLLARLINGEARGEPYVGQVAVGAVILNRAQHPRFPNTVAGVVYQPGAFESVSRGQIWTPVKSSSYRAAQAALSGWDPSGGAIYFWNPYKPVSRWIWSRRIISRIGKHVFAR